MQKAKSMQNIRSSDSPYYAVGEALWQLERTRSRSDFLKFAQAEWTLTSRDIASARAPLFTCTRVQSQKAKIWASDSYNSACAVKPFVTVLIMEAATYSLNSVGCG